MNKNLIFEMVENSFVFIYSDRTDYRLCCIANRTFLHSPDVSKIISFSSVKKHDINHPDTPCYGSWEIQLAGADRGTGMELLTELMSMADVDYVMCDRSSLSKDALIAWERIVNAMSSMTVQLDNHMTPVTPQEEDDCITWHGKDKDKYSLGNPYDRILKVPPIPSRLEHFNLDEYFKDDKQKKRLARAQMRKKFSEAFVAMVKRDFT
jgi:hypothetical protein